MALHQQKFREIVFQLLFSSNFLEGNEEETSLMLMGELKVSKRSVMDALLKAKAIVSKLSIIDAKIQEISLEYQFERISTAEKCALRLAIFELFYELDLPRKVVFAEAIRITRKFGSKEGAQFVNAILDQILLPETNQAGV
jgi:N utilization substance protein B